MELRHICSVLALAEELHFRRAAERVGLAQTALSAQIKALEDELGFALFFRTTRHVSLTQAGVVFVNEAKAVLARLDEAIEATRTGSMWRFSDPRRRSMASPGNCFTKKACSLRCRIIIAFAPNAN